MLAYMLVMYILPASSCCTRPSKVVSVGLYAIAEALTEPSYQRVMMTTFRTALTVTVFAILLGYPTAYYLSRLPSGQAASICYLLCFRCGRAC